VRDRLQLAGEKLRPSQVRQLETAHRRGRDETRQARGRRAELAVADYLVANGYNVMALNLRVGRWELDIVAQREGLIVVVEVRTRGEGSFEGPFQSITRSKRTRLKLAVERLWREKLVRIPTVERVRIDAAAVTFDGAETRVDYIPGAVSG
jgi:putative endonuclease